MVEKLKLEIGVICIVHIIAIILALVFFMIFYMRSNKDYAIKAFLITQISIVGWMMFKIFKTVSPTTTSRWWFIVGYYFCVCIFEVAFLEFTYAYYNEKPIKKRLRKYLYLIAMIQFLWVLTNPYHHLFYSKYNFWKDRFGVLFYVHSFIEYCFISVGFFYGYLRFKRSFFNEKMWYKILISSSIIVPLILNFLYITGYLTKFIYSRGIPIVFDVTPIMFVFSILVFVYATLKHDFINLSPIMKHEIVHKIDTPIYVLDSSFEVIYINEVLQEILPLNPKDIIEGSIKSIDMEKLLNYEKDIMEEIVLDNKFFNMSIKEISTIKETQYIVTLNNISDYKNIEISSIKEQNELFKSNTELENTINGLRKTSKIGARNYVARELHDIIGHSLVVTIKLLEVANLYFLKDRDLSHEALSNASIAIDSGIDNMNALSKISGSSTGEDLKKSIITFLDSISNTNTKTTLNFKGAYYKLNDKIFDVINKVCTELSTNTLKHGNAKEIFLSINIKKEDINILFMDNGIGSDNLIMGNGLIGIQERLKSINGTSQFVSSSGEGFMCKINIKM